MTHPLRHLALTTLATAALLGALPAQAVGRLSDINVIDRDSGETLPVYRYKGDHWVAGRPGARYAVSVRNASDGRVMSVVSVDGVNVVTGETASWEQTGYVLSPWQQYSITGWRKSDAEVAAFHFTASPASYAARTGRPDHVGVIGVALFREKPQPVAAPEPLPYNPLQRERLGAAEAGTAMKSQAEASSAPPPAAAPATQSANDSAARGESMAARRMAPASPAPRLGTGHGEREGSWVGHTSFERRSDRPDELIRIRYDSRDNLIAMGVIPPDAVPTRPNPFPGTPAPRYVPDPN